MDFQLTDDQQMIADQLRKFMDREVAPGARERDRAETFPGDILKKFADQGFLGGVVSTEYGGGGMDYVSYGLIFEEAARVDGSFRSTISVQTSLVCAPLEKWGTEEQKREWLPKLCSAEKIGCFGLTEPNAGSDAAALQTTAVPDGDDWVLNGQKMWITNGGHADVALVMAQTEPGAGAKRMAAFLVDTRLPGFSTQDIHGKLGLRASNTAQLFLQDVRIPAECMVGKVGDGFKVAMTALESGRYSVACGCTGIIQGCLDASLKYTSERSAFGKTINHFQLVQDMIARMMVDLDTSRLLSRRSGWLKDRGLPNVKETCMAKYHASEAAVRCALDAIQIHGGYGYSDEYPVERFLRDSKVATIFEGTSQVQKLILGRLATGVSAF